MLESQKLLNKTRLPSEVEPVKEEVISLFLEAVQAIQTTPQIAAQRFGQMVSLIHQRSITDVASSRQKSFPVKAKPNKDQQLNDSLIWERSIGVELLRQEMFNQTTPPFRSMDEVPEDVIESEPLNVLAWEESEESDFPLEAVKEFVLTGKVPSRPPATIDTLVMVHPTDNGFEEVHIRYIVNINTPTPTWRLMQQIYRDLQNIRKKHQSETDDKSVQVTWGGIMPQIIKEAGAKPQDYGTKKEYYRQLADAWKEKTGKSISPEAMRKRYERFLKSAH